MSLPPRGAWIEILSSLSAREGQYWSLPPRGAWIEIIYALPAMPWLKVAPPTGSVD